MIRYWVLLRGLSREHRHWHNFPKKIKESFPGSVVLTPDLPGCGSKYCEKSPFQIYDMVDTIRDQVKSEVKENSLNIVALSMGAMVAIEWMTRYPKDCQKSVLINTSLSGVSPFYHRLYPKNYWPLIYTLFIRSSIEKREQLIYQLTSQINDEKDYVLKQWIEFTKSCPVSKRNILAQLLAASKYRTPSVKPVVSTLLLNSSRDQLVNPQCSLQISRMWDWPIRTHPNSGHDIPLDDPDWVCQQIVEWDKESE